MIYYETDYLAHHGILGMKWGVRRYQNKDGSLTPEGRRRSGTKERKKSKHRTNLEQKYMSQGYSKEAAEKMASNRIKLETTLAVIGGVALAGVVAGTVYKVGKSRARKAINENGMTLKVGEALQRVQPDDSKEFYDRFYAVPESDKADVQKYRGLLGLNRKKKMGGAYKSKIDINKDIRVPSQKEAENIFNNLRKSDSKFDKLAQDSIDAQKMNDNFLRLMGYSIPKNKTSYELFNQSIVNDPKSDSGPAFFKALTDKGYGALLDINDQKFSGYNAKSPLIVFDTSAVTRNSITKLGNGEMFGNAVLDTLRENGQTYAVGTGLIGTGVAIKKYNNSKNQVIAEDKKNKKKKDKNEKTG